MMRQLPKIATCLLPGVIFICSAQAQAAILNPPDSFPLARLPEKTLRSHSLSLRPWILPGALIAYGAISLNSDGFTDINENIHEEIWTESVHPTTPVDTYLQFAPTAALLALNLAGVRGKHDPLDQTFLFVLSQGIMGVSVYTVKSVSHIQRPDGSGFNSFPSGHTAEAFAAAEFLREEYQGRSVWYGIGGYAAAAAVGYLRLYNNKHWLNDVVAGAGFGIASTRLAYLIYPHLKSWFQHTTWGRSVLLPYYNGSSGGFTFVHGFR